MVKFVVSPEIQQLISEYNTVKNLSEDEDGYIRRDSPSIEHLQLVNIASTLQTAYPSKAQQYSLHNMLKTTQLYIEPIQKAKPNPEYQARMEVLRRRLEQQEYDAMVANVKPQPKTQPLFSADETYSSLDAKMTKNQISAIINILFSMVSVFVAIFVWLRNSPDYLRVLWSLFFAAVVGVSEAGLYMLHWWNVEKSQSSKAIRNREKRRSPQQGGVTIQKKVQ